MYHNIIKSYSKQKRVSGTSLFTATGRVTLPGLNNPEKPHISFPNVLLNEGGDYNVFSGVFTCRIPGQYW